MLPFQGSNSKNKRLISEANRWPTGEEISILL
jgi:hypothetical protein